MVLSASSAHRSPSLPKPRGPLSEALASALVRARTGSAWPDQGGPDDAALSLWILYELSYRGYAEVDDRLELDPGLVGLRRSLEDELEQRRLRARWPGPPAYEGGFAEAFFAMVAADDGPSLARFVQREATADQVVELVQHGSLYRLKEADPFTFALPRLPAPARAALAELQYDEYGGGRPDRMHAHLYAAGMAALGLDAGEGGYVDEAPLEVLEQNNAMSLFGLTRRLRGACVGHLAAFEATSSLPCRQIAQGMERLGMPAEMRAYYEEHVEADAVHEQLAVRMVCEPLIAAEPDTEDDVWFGAWTCLDLEARLARRLLATWDAA
ncbi:iron-containing redox enzyme family protein [Nocardioides jiangxiensis]|uniref:Iron-containing redox enzyme family protein n=1 Tax=Nocardioides jiangxiensis TaxID=3064524 RepID=A0ABT9B0C1_9ACTN|nr:iron-containing redox enzyme family protein [Nocardioides sp. WY-20]MDO7868296.1 iron-containing redox enzyme family protein [Nocardioides sp. WY-20]